MKRYPVPLYRDSTVHGESSRPVDLNKMIYDPEVVRANYLMVAGVDLERPEQEMDVTAFLGAGRTVYASSRHLYTAVTEYEAGKPDAAARTKIYKFALRDGKVVLTEEGEVPGRILNQFSMDEHDGWFRLATTTGEMWREDEHISKNHLYVLDSSLRIKGKVEDMAPGERIYSVRFMGDRAYVVTYRNVDPLFVIDLADPENPHILGKLKIPGYSDYLHPYDENHLIGFGKETVVVEQKDAEGNIIGENALVQGMKISFFDITDVENPKEKFTEIIGDRGTESELLSNHKALLFDRDKTCWRFR